MPTARGAGIHRGGDGKVGLPWWHGVPYELRLKGIRPPKVRQRRTVVPEGVVPEEAVQMDRRSKAYRELHPRPPRRKTNRRWSAIDPQRFHRSPYWKRVRQQIFDLKGSLCYLCGGVATQIDHLQPKSRFPELCFAPDNLEPVCWPCNRKKNTR